MNCTDKSRPDKARGVLMVTDEWMACERVREIAYVCVLKKAYPSCMNTPGRLIDRAMVLLVANHSKRRWSSFTGVRWVEGAGTRFVSIVGRPLRK